MSCVQFENFEGLSFGTDILKEGWRTVAHKREIEEEKNGTMFWSFLKFTIVRLKGPNKTINHKKVKLVKDQINILKPKTITLHLSIYWEKLGYRFYG